MYTRAHRVPDCIVNLLMALDKTFTLETLTHDERLEVIAAAGHIVNFDNSARQAALNDTFQFERIHQTAILPGPHGQFQ